MNRRKRILSYGLILLLFCLAAKPLQAQEEPAEGSTDAPLTEPLPEGTELFGEEEDGADAADSAATEAVSPVIPEEEVEVPEETIITLVGKYDSADTAPVVRINEELQTITFRNHDIGRNYTLSYDETTRFLDVFGKETNIAQLKPGDLVDVTFLKSSKHLNSLQNSYGDRAFTYEGLREYKLPAKISVGTSAESMANILGSKYLLDLRTLILVNGVESTVAAILEGDEITVCGVDREIYAVTVTRGHGYLSLSSDTVGGVSLVGAWIQLDHSVIRKITPQMLMTAPEGEYTLSITGNGADYSTQVMITRGRETVVDTSGVQIEPPKTGSIKFEITPADAELRVDGSIVDKEQEMALSYGIHTLELNAEGYVSILRYLKVGSNRAVVRLGMERDPNAQQSQQNSGTGATAQDTSETSNHVISEVSLVTADSSGSTDSGESTATDANSGTTGTTDASGGETAGTGSTANDAGTSTDTAGTGTGQTTGDNTNTGQGDNTGDTQQQNGQQQNNGQQDTGGQQQGQTADTGGQNNGQTAPQIVYKIYVDEPAGALMFLDGNYIGYIPGSFDKVSGIHTVTLQRPGYNTISYNIELDETPADRTFRFPELEPEDGGEH